MRLDWGDIAHQVPKPVNAILTILAAPAQGRPDGILVALGHAMPPLLAGTPDENAELLRSMQSIPAISHGVYTLSRDRAVEVAHALLAAVEQHDLQAHQVAQP